MALAVAADCYGVEATEDGCSYELRWQTWYCSTCQNYADEGHKAGIKHITRPCYVRYLKQQQLLRGATAAPQVPQPPPGEPDASTYVAPPPPPVPTVERVASLEQRVSFLEEHRLADRAKLEQLDMHRAKLAEMQEELVKELAKIRQERAKFEAEFALLERLKQLRAAGQAAQVARDAMAGQAAQFARDAIAAPQISPSSPADLGATTALQSSSLADLGATAAPQSSSWSPADLGATTSPPSSSWWDDASSSWWDGGSSSSSSW